MNIYISIDEGRYDLMRMDEKQWCFSIRSKYGNVSTLFSEEPHWDNSVEDALNTIEARLKWYLFTSDREKKLEIINKIRENLNECEINWLTQKLARYEKQHDELTNKIKSTKEIIQHYKDESEVIMDGNRADENNHTKL